MMKITDRPLVLFNPSAGGGRALDKCAQLEGTLSRYGIKCEFTVTASEGHLRELAGRAARKGRTIVGAGGDSTFHILVNEIMAAGGRSPAGLVGIGSSNDISLEFGLETMDKACRALKEGNVRRIDLGLITAEDQAPVFFLGQANVGLGAFVNLYIAGRAKKKFLGARSQTAAGLLGIIDAYRTRKVPVNLRISDGGRTRRDAYILALFSNIRYWATGRILCPEARPDDGRLDACLFRDCSLLRLARLNSLARRGRHGGHRGVELVRSASFEVTADEPFLVQTDGEILSGPTGPLAVRRARFEAVPAALNIIAGPSPIGPR